MQNVWFLNYLPFNVKLFYGIMFFIRKMVPIFQQPRTNMKTWPINPNFLEFFADHFSYWMDFTSHQAWAANSPLASDMTGLGHFGLGPLESMSTCLERGRVTKLMQPPVLRRAVLGTRCDFQLNRPSRVDPQAVAIYSVRQTLLILSGRMPVCRIGTIVHSIQENKV